MAFRWRLRGYGLSRQVCGAVGRLLLLLLRTLATEVEGGAEVEREREKVQYYRM